MSIALQTNGGTPGVGRRPQVRTAPRLERTVVRFAILLLAFSCVAPAAADDTLARLIQNGDRRAAMELIESGAGINEAQGDGTTPLHWAAYRIDVALVERLLERGADPDVTNLYGSSPLAEAVKTGNERLVELLLAAGADPEAPNQDGQTVLMLASRSGSLPIVDMLVTHGADVNAREHWREQTALMWAADAGFPVIVDYLIDAGAEVEIRAEVNDWPSQITSEPRAQYRPTGGLTPLLYAARAGCAECVRAMLDAGAAIDRPNPDGVTPLIIAIENLGFDAAAILLERGANPHLWDWWGRTALYVAVHMKSYEPRQGEAVRGANSTSAEDIVRMLLAAGVNPNPQLNMHRPSRGGNIGRFADDLLTTGATPLLRAAISHDLETIDALLDAGAVVDLPNVMGVTPLMAAAGMGVGGRIGFSPSPDAQAGAIETIDVLIEAGADINARVSDTQSRTARIARISTMTERQGQTALYGAIRFAWIDVVRHLVDRGAEVDIVDDFGRSPVDAALGEVPGRGNTRSEEIADLLSGLIDGA